MTHVTCGLTVKNRDQLRNPTLGNRLWATFAFFRVEAIMCAPPQRKGRPLGPGTGRIGPECTTICTVITIKPRQVGNRHSKSLSRYAAFGSFVELHRTHFFFVVVSHEFFYSEAVLLRPGAIAPSAFRSLRHYFDNEPDARHCCLSTPRDTFA